MKLQLMVMSRNKGFTIIEILVSVVIISILASAVLPMAELALQRHREHDLRAALRELRTAIDHYRIAVDEGRVTKKSDESGYPRRLEDLVAGVPDAKNPKGGNIVFLRRIPRDPFALDATLTNSQTWGKRSYLSSHDEPKEGIDIFDVYSRSSGQGINGIPYRLW